MHQDTLEHAFEPFFTTKDVGKGSGLGLSMVYGFVNQSGGRVRIDSTPGHGTTVQLLMPRAEEAAVDEAETGFRSDPVGSGQTILVVEDDLEVRGLVVRLLSRLGYTSVEAEDAIEAMSVLENRSDVDLLFTDIVLPRGKTGADLAEDALARWPDLKVVYMSGYSRDALSRDGRLESDVDLVEKPFEKSQLAQVLHEVLSR
jgi:CheY-like chemotaxis protein